MKRVLLISTVVLLGSFVSAQDITAVTGLTKGKIEFNDFRKIDANNLNAAKVLLTKSDKISFESKETELTKICNCGRYIAAMTESKNGEIFYIPMNSNTLSVVNPSAKTATVFDIPNSKMDSKDQATYYARMTTTPDGYMYALNNIGSEFLKISSNGTIQNLGSVDELAIFAKSSGIETSVYGGDMIADAFGNVYVLTASANVFKINPNNLNTEYLGKIKGLPENFTVNAAAVEKDGRVLLGTSSLNHGFYSLDFSSLEAEFKADYSAPVYDMSSPNFLKQDELDQIVNLDSNYSLYPTLVKNSELNIVSKSNDNAVLRISVWNLNNKQVYTNSVQVKSIGEFQVKLNGALQPGIYVLKAVNQNGQEVLNTKFTLVR
jgi:hypothetical protein